MSDSECISDQHQIKNNIEKDDDNNKLNCTDNVKQNQILTPKINFIIPDEFKIDKNKLILHEIVGSGSFSVVVRGE